MKKMVVILLLILVVSALFAGTYRAQVSMSSEAAITEPQTAKLGYQVLGPIELTAGEEATKPTFTLYNRFPLPALVTVSVVNKPVSFTITPPPPIFVPVYPPPDPADNICITYTARTEGDYMVTYRVMADIISGSSAHVELTFDVPFIVKPKSLSLPPLPQPPSP